MSWNDKLKRCKDGTIRYYEQYAKGTIIDGVKVGGQFKKSSNPKFYNGQQVGIWNKEPQQKIVPEINHKDFVKGNFYRAAISLNIPLNGTKRKPNYKNFTYVVVDELENIDLKEMYKEFIEEIESELHYKRSDFWFDSSYSDCDIQNPKPYTAKNSSVTFES